MPFEGVNIESLIKLFETREVICTVRKLEKYANLEEYYHSVFWEPGWSLTLESGCLY